MGTVYAVASAKGGVGKTTTTAALATVLAGSGADVVAIDADLGMANLASAVGVTPGEVTLHDVLAGGAATAAAVRDGPAGLRVVPGAADLDAYAAADPSGLRGVIESFAEADYVFVDGSAGLSHDSALPLGLADETLLVSTPDRTALGDTEKTRQLTERLGGTVAGAAITLTESGFDAATDETVAETLDAPVLGSIPEDEAVARAAAADRPLAIDAPNSPAMRAYRDLARALTGVAVDGTKTNGATAGDDGETTDDGGGERDGSEVGGGDDIVAAEESGPEEPAAEEPTGADETAGRGDDPDAVPDADAVATEPEDDAVREGDAALAGSVPFRDDDEATRSEDAAGSDAGEDGDATGSEDGDGGSGGFFSRLLKR